ncbi:MAG: glycosyltransferase family 4 protein [Bacteroidales bacterium]
MKVLHIEDRFHPGMGYQINFFARYHHPDHPFSILTADSARLWSASGEATDFREIDREFERAYGVSIIRLPTTLDRRNRQNLWLKGLTGAIRKIDPDILYVHTIESYSSLRVILSRRTLSRYRVFFDTHTLLNQFQSGLKFKMLLWFLRNVASKRMVRFDAKVFATVPENRMILEKKYGIPADRILYSPIGTDLILFGYDPVRRTRLREKEQIGQQECVLLYTGKINRRKNPHLVLKALELIETKINVPFYIYFVGASDQAYFEENMKVGFINEKIHVKFVPAVPVPELAGWYSMADFAVFPAENTLSALDAQACSLPVIMQEDMTNTERLKKGGLTYERGNLRDLSEKILWMIGNPDRRKAMGSAGAAYIKATFDYRKIVEKMEADLGLLR